MRFIQTGNVITLERYSFFLSRHISLEDADNRTPLSFADGYRVVLQIHPTQRLEASAARHGRRRTDRGPQRGFP